MKKKNRIPLWGILTGVSAVLLTVSVVGSYMANKYGSAAINMMFGTSNFKTIKDDSAEAKDFYPTSYEFTRNGQSMYEEDTKAIEENREKS